jgi:hypothetical protein
MKKVFYLLLALVATSCSSKLTNTTYTNEKDVAQYAANVETDEALITIKKEIKNENNFVTSTIEGGYINNELVKLVENSIGQKSTNIYKFYLKNGQLIYSTQEEFIMNYDGNKPLSRLINIAYGDKQVLSAGIKEVVSQYDREMIDMNSIQMKPYSVSYSSLMSANEKKIKALTKEIDPVYKVHDQSVKKGAERLKGRQQ